jgi:uncharacterized membrane protein YhaH (DUF805 family)
MKASKNEMFSNIFSFEGRIRRTEYVLTYIIYSIAINSLEYLLLSDEEYSYSINFYIYLIFLLPMIYILLAQGAKRCHDRGNSGWYQIIPFYSLWMTFGDSDDGPNEYGPNPKGIGNYNEINDIGKLENE